VIVAVLLALLLVFRNRALERNVADRTTAPAIALPTTAPGAEVHSGFIYGRVTTGDGTTHEGRLRWGGDQEAFWGDFFNGTKKENPWAVHLPNERSTKERRIEVFGFEIGGTGRSNLRRLFMARFGDIARIEAHFRDAQVTLKSGTVFDLDRFAAGDIDDGVRVWDSRREVVDLDARDIRTIEFLPTALVAAPDRLYGTVRTQHGDFTGFIQWDEQDGISTDELNGRAAAGKRTLS